MKEIRFYWVKALEFDYRRRGNKLEPDWYWTEDEKREKVDGMLSLFPELDL